MPTNEERREVAERLRMLASHLAADEELAYDVLGRFDIYGIMELADLIEPEPERTCQNLVIDFNRISPREHRTDNFICSACRELFCADGECVNHPIDWAYCPNCGAKVVE